MTTHQHHQHHQQYQQNETTMNEMKLEKMKTMSRSGMHRAFRGSRDAVRPEHMTADELVAILIKAEWDERTNGCQKRSVKNARFRYKAVIEQINFIGTREAHRNQILRLADCEFVIRGENILITGSTGTGKSYIASALGLRPALQGTASTTSTVRSSSLGSR